MIHRHARIAYLVAFVTLPLLACGGSQKSNETGAASMSVADTGSVLVTVNGQEIKSGAVDAEVARLFRQFGGQMSPFQAEQMKGAITQQAQDNLINKILLGEAIEKENVAISDEEMNEVLGSFRQRLGEEQAYQDYLARLGMTEEEFLGEARNDMRIEKLLSGKAEAGAPPTGEEVAQYYTENPDDFQQEEQVRASHILLLFEEGDNDSTKTVKLAKIKQIRKDLLAGADFAETAREKSGCPSAKNGGDLGWFGKDRMVKPFEDAAFTQRVGQLSDVVETQFGYHLIKVMDHKDARTVPLDEAKPQIEEQLAQQKRRDVIDQYIESLRQQANVVFAEPQGSVG